MKEFFSEIRGAIVSTLVLAVVCCGFYPLIVYGLSQAFFHDKANGSLIVGSDGTVRGSRLLGQGFADPKYFHPRPSAAGQWLRCSRLQRQQSWSNFSETRRRGEGSRRRLPCGKWLGPKRLRSSRCRDCFRQWLRSAHQPTQRRVADSRASRRRRGSPQTKCANSSDNIPMNLIWVSSATPGQRCPLEPRARCAWSPVMNLPPTQCEQNPSRARHLAGLLRLILSSSRRSIWKEGDFTSGLVQNKALSKDYATVLE